MTTAAWVDTYSNTQRPNLRPIDISTLEAMPIPALENTAGPPLPVTTPAPAKTLGRRKKKKRTTDQSQQRVCELGENRQDENGNPLQRCWPQSQYLSSPTESKT